MEEIDKAMAETRMDLDDTDKVHSLRDEGDKLHDEGNHDGAVEAPEEAREIIANSEE